VFLNNEVRPFAFGSCRNGRVHTADKLVGLLSATRLIGDSPKQRNAVAKDGEVFNGRVCGRRVRDARAIYRLLQTRVRRFVAN
jgi:hypothetical protein